MRCPASSLPSRRTSPNWTTSCSNSGAPPLATTSWTPGSMPAARWTPVAAPTSPPRPRPRRPRPPRKSTGRLGEVLKREGWFRYASPVNAATRSTVSQRQDVRQHEHQSTDIWLRPRTEGWYSAGVPAWKLRLHPLRRQRQQLRRRPAPRHRPLRLRHRRINFIPIDLLCYSRKPMKMGGGAKMLSLLCS